MALTREERVLLRGCRDGDEDAWLALYRAHAADVGLFLGGMLPGNSEIDDLVQKVFLQFLASLDRFRGEAGIRTWLHRIARHVALHELRGASRRQRHVRAYAETVDRDGPDPEDQVLARDRLALIRALLDRLDGPFREVWILREISGLSVAETAAVLEVPATTVRTRHHRARQRILALLEELDSRDDRLMARGHDHLKLLPSEGETR